MLYIVNSISLQMINGAKEGAFEFKQISADEVVEMLSRNKYLSCIGHEDTAKYLSELLGVELIHNPLTLRVENGAQMIVCQYCKGRLRKNISFTPDAFKFYLVKVNYVNLNSD